MDDTRRVQGRPACCSHEGELIGDLVVKGVGRDVGRHRRGRVEYRLEATLPVLPGLDQIDETFAGWRFGGHGPSSVGAVAMWTYLLFALVVLPVLVPPTVLLLEPVRRRWPIMPFIVRGAAVPSMPLETMLAGHPSLLRRSYHRAYSVALQHGMVIIGLHYVATCGSLRASGIRRVVWFGVANHVAVVVAARLTVDGLTSLWCFYASLASGAIAPHRRLSTSDRRDRRVVAPQWNPRSAAFPTLLASVEILVSTM